MNLSFLKVIGKVGKKAASIIPFIDKQIDTIAAISNVIIQTEVLGQALKIKGVDKLKAATPSVAQVIINSSVLIDKEIQDPKLFMKGSEKFADGMVDILNSIKGKDAL